MKKEKECPPSSSFTNSQYDQFLKETDEYMREINSSKKKPSDAINKSIEEGLYRPPHEI